MIKSELVTELQISGSSEDLMQLLSKTWEDGEKEVFSLVMNLLCS